MNKIRAEYIWMDGHLPTQKLRSKTKVLDTAVSFGHDDVKQNVEELETCVQSKFLN